MSRLTVPFVCLVLMLPDVSAGVEINQQSFKMTPPERGTSISEMILENEIPEVHAKHVAVSGPATYSEQADKDHALVLLFLAGQGEIHFQGEKHAVVPETIAVPIDLDKVELIVPEREVVHLLVIHKAYNEQDLVDMANFANRKPGGIYFRKFSDCEPYREAIKSPKTVSRTVLPAEYIPRVAMGTVETTGPDEVGAHRHPMLDQLFLALAENDVVVTADDTHARLTEFSLLHIPLGSLHGVTVEPNRKLYYMWMDFFLTKEGEEWLKTHKPVTE